MDVEAARLIGKGLCIAGIGGSGIGEGYLIGKALEAIGRNPKMEGNIYPKMFIGVALAESTAIYGLVAFFII